MYFNRVIIILKITLFIHVQGNKNVKDEVERALDYVYLVSKSSCSEGTKEVLYLNFDHSLWDLYTDAAIRNANLMSEYLVHGNGRLNFLTDEFFFMLVRNTIQVDLLIFGAGIALEPGVYSKYPLFCPYAYKKNNTVRSHDIAINYDYLDPTTEWYYQTKTKIRENITVTTDTISYRVNNSILPEITVTKPVALLKDGHWTYPYFDCGGGDIWMVTYTSPIFFIDRQNETPQFRGLAGIDIDMTNIDINQCDTDPTHNKTDSNQMDLFRGTHKCAATTKCVPKRGLGFKTGAYDCFCEDGYYFPHANVDVKAFNGTEVEEYFRYQKNLDQTLFKCVKCAPGCDTCVDGSPCLYKSSEVIRLLTMMLMVFTIAAICIVSGITFVYRKHQIYQADFRLIQTSLTAGMGTSLRHFVRKRNYIGCSWRNTYKYDGTGDSPLAKCATYEKADNVPVVPPSAAKLYHAIKTGSPLFLQLMCLGGILMCFQYFALFLDVSIVVCTIGIWPLNLGFFIMYGSLILKTWRISVIFSVGTTKRIHLPDLILIQRFCLIGVLVFCLLMTWTLASPPTIETIKADDKLKVYLCSYGVWEYVSTAVEVLFLLYGGYLCYTVRKAPAHFNESKHITWSIYNAIILGTFMALVTRFILTSSGPDVLCLLNFIQIQVYVTVTMTFIFAPKFWAVYKKVDIGETSQSSIIVTQTITGWLRRTKVFPQLEKSDCKQTTTTGTQTNFI